MSTPIEAESLGERELSKLDTAGSVMMTKELFEKLYLSPHTNIAGTFARRSAIQHLCKLATDGDTFLKWLTMLSHRGLAGFLLALTPLSCDLMGWRGAGGGGAASV
jgi:uncharacterized protein